MSSLLFGSAAILVGSALYLARQPAQVDAADQPNPTVSYQGQLSDAAGSAVGDGMHSAVFSLYSASSGGTALWSETWATSTSFQTSLSAQAVTSSVSLSYNAPTTTDEANLYVHHTLYNINRRDQVTVTAVDTGTNTITVTPTSRTWESGDFITNKLVTFDGAFSVRLPATSTLESIFNVASATRLYLGVNINGDGEMQPRKQISYAPLAINALYLGGVPSSSFARLDTANTFATTTFTGSPGGTAVNQGGLYVNPASPGADQTLLGIANNGSERLRVDAEGDVFASGTLAVLGVHTTSTNPLLLYGGAATGYVQVGASLPATYHGFAATSSDDLLVGNELNVDGTAWFGDSLYVSSTAAITGATSLHGGLTVRGGIVYLPDSTARIEVPDAKVNGTFAGALVTLDASTASVANGYVIGTGYNGEDRFSVDVEGDVFASGTLAVLGIKTTSTNPLLVYGGSATSYVRVGQALPAAYRGFAATSSDDLFVANDLFTDGAARFDGAVWASSTLQSTGVATFYNDVNVNGALIIPDTAGGLQVGTVETTFANWVNFNAPGYVDNWEKAPVAITAGSADPMSFLLGAGAGGVEAFSVRAGGYVFASGTLTAMGLTTTSTDPLRVYGGAATGYVLVGSALPAAYRGFSATSSDDLFVADELFADGLARFDGQVQASSSLLVGGDLTVYGVTTTLAAASSSLVFNNGVFLRDDVLNSVRLGYNGSGVALRVELAGSTPRLQSVNSSIILANDSIQVDSAARGFALSHAQGMINCGTDRISFVEDFSSCGETNLVLDLNGSMPFFLSSTTSSTIGFGGAVQVSSSDGFYLRNTINGAPVAAQLRMDDTNDEFLLDVQSTSSGAGPLDVAVKLDDQAAGISYFRVRSSTTAVWSVDSTGTVGAGGSDVAERYPSAELLLPGDVVAADPERAGHIRRATGSPGESVLGVVSTKPAIILGFYDSGSETLGYDVALVGRVPIRVTDGNGPIAIGDLLTLGSEPGTAVRRTDSGVAIGTALESLASGSGSVLTFINVASQPDVLQVVPATARDAGLKVYRFAPYAGTIEVANLIVTETIEVRGSVRVAGSLQLEGALLTEFWDASDGTLRVGDAAAIVGPNEVDVTWADRSPALPAIGLVAEVVPPEQVSATATAEYLALLAQRGRLLDASQLRRLRVAVGGTLAGFSGLVPGTRYYLATQPPYPAAGTSSQESLAAEAPTALGAFEQLLGVARDERSLLLYVSPQYQVNEPPPVIITPAPSPVPPPPDPEPVPVPEPEGEPKPEAVPVEPTVEPGVEPSP